MGDRTVHNVSANTEVISAITRDRRAWDGARGRAAYKARLCSATFPSVDLCTHRPPSSPYPSSPCASSPSLSPSASPWSSRLRLLSRTLLATLTRTRLAGSWPSPTSCRAPPRTLELNEFPFVISVLHDIYQSHFLGADDLRQRGALDCVGNCCSQMFINSPSTTFVLCVCKSVRTLRNLCFIRQARRQARERAWPGTPEHRDMRMQASSLPGTSGISGSMSSQSVYDPGAVRFPQVPVMRVKLYSLFLATYDYLSGSLFGPQLILEPSDVAPASALANEAHARPGKVITPEFNAFVDDLLHGWKRQGLAVAVVTSSSVEYGTYGLATEEGDPVTKDTLFGIASCSKAFTSAALGALMEDFAEGKNTTALPPSISKLSWKTKVKDILPGWGLQDRYASDYATIQDLATHVTGAGRHDYSYSPTDTPQDIINRLKLLKPAHELREQWSYNSQMYMVLGEVVAKLSGKPFEEYVQERLFDPIGMKSTTYSTIKATHSGHMSHVWNSDGRRVPYAFPESAVGIVAPAGGVITNIVDLSRWAATLLNRGTSPCTKKEALKFSTIDTLTTATTIMEGKAPAVDGSVKGYAKGWWRYSYRGHEVIAHSGSGPGISAHVRILPHANVGVIVLGNSGPSNPTAHAVARRALEDALGQSRIPWPETPETVVKATPLPVGSIPPISLAHYAGTYKNEAYGAIRLCERDDKSAECATTVKTFKTIECARARNSSVLYGEWPRLWSSHLRLTHVKGHMFFNDLPSVFAAGYGKNTTPFASSSGRDGRGVLMEFAVEGERVVGMGLMEDVQMLVNGDKRPLRERADAWFERV